MRTLDISSRCLTHSILIYGGFGHRPPHVRSWILFGVYLEFLDLYVSLCACHGKAIVIGLFIFCILQSRVSYHIMSVCILIPSHLIPKTVSLLQILTDLPSVIFGQHGARYYRWPGGTTAAWSHPSQEQQYRHGYRRYQVPGTTGVSWRYYRWESIVLGSGTTGSSRCYRIL